MESCISVVVGEVKAGHDSGGSDSRRMLNVRSPSAVQRLMTRARSGDDEDIPAWILRLLLLVLGTFRREAG